MHPATNDEPNQIPVADSSQKTCKNIVFSGCKFPKMFPNVLVTKHMGCMHQALACLAHLASHRPRSPCLHQQGAGKARCWQGERGRYEATNAKQAKTGQASQARDTARIWDRQETCFVTDMEPRASKWDFDGIAWQLFSRPSTWRGRNPAGMSKMG